MLDRFREGEVHLRATWVLTRVDVIANVAVIVTGLAALLTHLHWLDLNAIALASTVMPALRARSLEVDAKRAAAVAAGQLPDPKLGLGIDNFPVSGPPTFTFSGDNRTMARVGLSQDIPNLSKRCARVGRARADVNEASAILGVDERRFRVAAALASGAVQRG